MNQVCGIQNSLNEPSSTFRLVDNYEDFTFVKKLGLMKFYVGKGASFQGYFCQTTKTYLYIWGIPSHPDLKGTNILKWCLNQFLNGQYGCFKELIGTFVIFIDEPKQRRITVITDILGIRPMFFKLKNGKVILGSNVWDLYKSGMSTGNVDYDAVSSWVAFGVNFTDGTLFMDFRRFSPGSITSFKNGKITELQYAKFESKNKRLPIEQVVHEINEQVRFSTKTLLADHSKLIIALSGGFDSRYLLAQALNLNHCEIKCASVGFNRGEKIVAEKVAKTLNLPFDCFSTGGSVWNLYDQVFHQMSDGFFISKSVPHKIAEQFRSIPMLNGFMGDALIRGDSDKVKNKYESEWKSNLVDVLFWKHSKVRFKLFRKKISNNIKMRSRVPMEKAVWEGSKLGKVFAWQDYYYTHRFYISNNFLQHINISEALIPFYHWGLLSYKMEHAYDLFTWNTYRLIFKTYYPELYDICHAKEIHSKRNILDSSKCTKEWAKQLFFILGRDDDLSLLRKNFCKALCLAGITGFNKLEHSILLFERLYLFEKIIKDAGINFDWECI